MQVTDIGQKITQEMSAHQKLESEKERLRKTYEDLQVDEGTATSLFFGHFSSISQCHTTLRCEIICLVPMFVAC